MLTRSQVEDLGFNVINERYPWQFTNGLLDIYTSIYPKSRDFPKSVSITIYNIRYESMVFYGRLENREELVNVLEYINR